MLSRCPFSAFAVLSSSGKDTRRWTRLREIMDFAISVVLNLTVQRGATFFRIQLAYIFSINKFIIAGETIKPLCRTTGRKPPLPTAWSQLNSHKLYRQVKISTSYCKVASRQRQRMIYRSLTCHQTI